MTGRRPGARHRQPGAAARARGIRPAPDPDLPRQRDVDMRSTRRPTTASSKRSWGGSIWLSSMMLEVHNDDD